MTVHADRVQQTTATTGTGTLSLSAVTDGHRGFVATVGDGAEVTYLLVVTDGAGAITAWEIGTGTVTTGSPDTLTRVLSSSSTGALLDLAAGTHTVSLVVTGATIDSMATLTGTQTLTNKTLGNYTETVFAITDGVTVNLDPNNGPVQTWTLGASRTPGQTSWAAGQSITLLVDDGADYTITWTTLAVVWKTDGGTAPTLQTTGVTAIVLWKVGATIYGARVGDA